MTAEELFARLKCETAEPVDVDGKPIAEFAGLVFKPLNVADMLAVSEYVKANGQNCAYQAVFARGVLNPDGSRVVSDEEAAALDLCKNSPVERAVTAIRALSGRGEEAADGQKKAGSPDGKK
jgi:hypothetical protein